MQFSVMQTDVRSRFVEPTARFFTDAEIKRWLNLGYHDFVGRTGWCERVAALAPVANQWEYSLPSDILHVMDVMWNGKYKLLRNDTVDLNANMGLSPTSVASRPYLYCALPWDRKIRLYPAPSAAGTSTTLNGDITAAATTITVASTTNFPTRGRVLIESEQILYFNTSATQFLQCVRGDGFTTAATHADTTAVSEGKIELYLTYTPVDLSADADVPRITTAYHEALILYATHIGLQKDDKWAEAEKTLQEYLRVVEHANLERRKESLDRHPYIKDEDDYSVYSSYR